MVAPEDVYLEVDTVALMSWAAVEKECLSGGWCYVVVSFRVEWMFVEFVAALCFAVARTKGEDYCDVVSTMMAAVAVGESMMEVDCPDVMLKMTAVEGGLCCVVVGMLEAVCHGVDLSTKAAVGAAELRRYILEGGHHDGKKLTTAGAGVEAAGL